VTRFTVLLPIVRPPIFLPFAIDSVLAQNLSDFELFVVCDGAPPETIACAEDYARRDPRVKVRAFPKGERHGEAHRHQVLGSASGRYVAHVADDDLWLPDHLEEMEALLATADFGNLLHVYVRPDGRVEILPGDLGSPDTRRRMLSEPFNVFGPTFAGYRLDTYRRLPVGWTPAPPDVWTDLHMWRKFLRADGLTFATRAAVTAIHFAAFERAEFTPERRRDEIQRHWKQVQDPSGRREIVQAAWRSLLDRALQREDEVPARASPRTAD
jgi:glycosyltransferase involved in cell wall biosynthesis